MPSTLEIDLEVGHAPSSPISSRHLHAAVVAAVDESPDDHTAAHKRFSIWPLLAGGTDSHARLRVGWLADSDVPSGLLRPGRTWRLGSMNATCVGHQISHKPFAALATVSRASAGRLSFHSPTSFSRSGRSFPLPDPYLILKGLHRRWNAFAGDCAMPESVLSEVLAHIELRDFDITACHVTQERVVGRGDTDLGFIGWVDLALSGRPTLAEELAFGALCSFAEIAGVGHQTTHGYGATTWESGEHDD